MTVTFEPFPGDGPYGLDGPQFGLAGSPEMNRLYRHCPIMYQRPAGDNFPDWPRNCQQPESAMCDRWAVDAESWDWSLRIFDHVEVHASDFSESVRFYETVLAPLGTPRVAEGSDWAGFPNFNVVDRRPPTANLHLCFHARSREQVEGFHQAGVDAGFRTNGGPGYRDYAPGYYAAFLLDPDGNNVEALYRDEGNIGHGIGPPLR